MKDWINYIPIAILLMIIAVIFSLGVVVQRNRHQCPRPSVEQVQTDLNEAGENLDVDGVAGKKTVEAWMFHSPGWEAENERNMK